MKVLVIGDEDSADSDLIPRIVAAGGDVSMVRYLSYDQGEALSLIRHAGHLDEIVVKGGFRVVVFRSGARPFRLEPEHAHAT